MWTGGSEVDDVVAPLVRRRRQEDALTVFILFPHRSHAIVVSAIVSLCRRPSIQQWLRREDPL